MPILGAHESVADGLHLAFDRIQQVGGEALQIFTRNQRQWQCQPLKDDEISLFKAAWQKTGSMPVLSHASYLINLASSKPELADKSIMAFTAEILRCEKLGIPFVVIHPGSHGGDGVEAGLVRFTRALDQVMAATGAAVTVLLETTAGQGSSLGSRFEELAFMIEHSQMPQRLGVCLDTCHIFAAGYDIRTVPAYNRTMEEFDRLIGIDRLKFCHLNDSKNGLASHVDRHEHIGQGAIGLAGFKNLLTDPRFAAHPMTLETPKGVDLQEDRNNLKVLRELMAERPA